MTLAQVTIGLIGKTSVGKTCGIRFWLSSSADKLWDGTECENGDVKEAWPLIWVSENARAHMRQSYAKIHQYLEQESKH